MITVRPVIIDASICYGIPCNMGNKAKSKFEILHMDAAHAQGWRFRNMSDESAAKLADPSLDNVVAFLSCDVLFSVDVHPTHGHFAWDKEDIPKRIYIHHETKDTFYMQGQHGHFIQGTRVRPKRVTRKKKPYYIDPRDGSMIHSTAYREKTKEYGHTRTDLVLGDKEYFNAGFPYYQDDSLVCFDLDLNEVPRRIFKETVNALYDMNWKADAITNFSTVMDMLAEDGA